jgi:hypothetical protein
MACRFTQRPPLSTPILKPPKAGHPRRAFRPVVTQPAVAVAVASLLDADAGGGWHFHYQHYLPTGRRCTNSKFIFRSAQMKTSLINFVPSGVPPQKTKGRQINCLQCSEVQIVLYERQIPTEHRPSNSFFFPMQLKLTVQNFASPCPPTCPLHHHFPSPPPRPPPSPLPHPSPLFPRSLPALPFSLAV